MSLFQFSDIFSFKLFKFHVAVLKQISGFSLYTHNFCTHCNLTEKSNFLDFEQLFSRLNSLVNEIKTKHCDLTENS